MQRRGRSHRNHLKHVVPVVEEVDGMITTKDFGEESLLSFFCCWLTVEESMMLCSW